MKNNKNFLHDAKVQSAIVAAVAVLFLILIFFAKNNMILLALWISLSLSALIISVWIFVSGLRDDATHYNYFLYDRKTKKSVPEAQLSFEMVNGKLSEYLADYVSAPLSLWSGIPANLREQLKNVHFRVPVAYRMLFDLSVLSPDEILRRFGDAEESVVAYVCRTLSEAGDKDMADYIFGLKRRFGEEQTHVSNFFSRNKRCFEGRIFNYVKRNLGRYVMKKK